MTTRTIISCLLFSVLGISACKKDSNSAVEYNIEDEFAVTFMEDLGPDGSRLNFYAETVQKVYCIDTGIEIERNTSEDGREITLDIRNIVNEGDCTHKDYPATGVTPMGGLVNRSYNININLDGTIPNEGKLEVSSESYNLTLYTDNGIEVKHNELHKIKKGTIWGYIGHDNSPAAIELAESFSKLIHEEFDTETTLSNGFYTYFTVSSGGVTFPVETTTDQVLTFGFVMDTNIAVETFKTYVKGFTTGNTLFDSGKVVAGFYAYNGEQF